MAKKTTRRSISIKGIHYQRLKDHCEAVGVPISAYIEQIVTEKLDEAGAPIPKRVVPHADRTTFAAPDAGPAHSGHWTF
jgi:hypothetical protein